MSNAVTQRRQQQKKTCIEYPNNNKAKKKKTQKIAMPASTDTHMGKPSRIFYADSNALAHVLCFLFSFFFIHSGDLSKFIHLFMTLFIRGEIVATEIIKKKTITNEVALTRFLSGTRDKFVDFQTHRHRAVLKLN